MIGPISAVAPARPSCRAPCQVAARNRLAHRRRWLSVPASASGDGAKRAPAVDYGSGPPSRAKAASLPSEDGRTGRRRRRPGQASACWADAHRHTTGDRDGRTAGAPAFGPLGNPANFGAPPLSVQGLAGDPVKKQFGAGLNITQTLLDFGRTQYLTAARRGLFQASEQDAEVRKAAVLVEVQRAYLDVLRAQQLAQIAQENVRQRDTTLRQARLFVEGQLKPGVDLQTAQANASEASVGLIGARNEVRYAFAALNNAMGATSMTTYQLEEGAATVGVEFQPPRTVDEAMSRSLAQRRS